MTGLFWSGSREGRPAPALERRSLLRKVHPRSNRDNRRSAQPGTAATAPPPPPPPARGSTPPEHACRLPSPPSTYPLPRVPGTGKLCPSRVPPLRERERETGKGKGRSPPGIKAQDGGGGGGGGGYGSCSNPCPAVAQKNKRKHTHTQKSAALPSLTVPTSFCAARAQGSSFSFPPR